MCLIALSSKGVVKKRKQRGWIIMSLNSSLEKLEFAHCLNVEMNRTLWRQADMAECCLGQRVTWHQA